MKRFLLWQRTHYLISKAVTAAMLVSIACSETTTPGTPVKLAFITQPSNPIVAGRVFPPVLVAIQDADGRTVTTASNSVTLSTGIDKPGSALLGAVTVSAVNGVATFASISIDATSTYTLSATSPKLASATSVQFAVVPGAAAHLAFTIQPVTTIAHSFIPDIVVAVKDEVGNNVRDGVYVITLSIETNPNGAKLSGTSTRTSVDAFAHFSGLSLDKTGTGYTFAAVAAGLIRAVSAPFDMTFGPATKLEFIDQPSLTPPGASINPAVTVGIKDVAGNLVTTATNSITISVSTNGAQGSISGTTSVAAVNGVATFSDLRINNAGFVYTLTATASGLESTTSRAFSVRNPLEFSAVSAGYFHTCGITKDGSGFCWGDNTNGQLGALIVASATVPFPISGGLTFDNMGAGRDHTCGVTTGRVAYCWGSNASGRLGTESVDLRTPALVSGGLTFASAIAGYAHSCGVTTASTAYCWGENASGSVGNGTLTASTSPSLVVGGLSFKTISAGRFFSCGLTNAGAAYCWGDNSASELGDGSAFSQNTPAPVSGEITFATISAGGFHACGLTPAGVAYCWGANGAGQLGTGTDTNSNVPVAVAGGLTFAMISAGNRHTCGVTTDSRAYCWGDNSSANLGDGTTMFRLNPQPVSGGLTFSSVSAGRFHSCGVTTGGTLYCWGTNNSGQLGDGTTVTRLVPVPVR